MSFRLAIVGGGPNCVYALDRIAALCLARDDLPTFEIDIFDRGGWFGSGEVHNDRQQRNSLLNRIAGQIGFGANHTSQQANHLLPEDQTFDFMQWIAASGDTVNDDAANLSENDWPPRRILGSALKAAFNNHVEIIKRENGARVSLHAELVTDIEESQGRYKVHCEPQRQPMDAYDHILLATGVQHLSHDYLIARAGMSDVGGSPSLYIPDVYPLEEKLSMTAVKPGDVVAIRGTGVTAVDVLLSLTEGRGGSFVVGDDGSSFTYHRSGNEPAKIHMFGRSGYFCHARPINQKKSALKSAFPEGRYFNRQTIARLREQFGIANELRVVGPVRQLCFDEHVLPVMVLEMAYVYYQCLLGDDATAELRQLCQSTLEGLFDLPSARHQGTTIDFIERTMIPFLEDHLDGYFRTCQDDENAARDLNPVLFHEITAGRSYADASSQWLHPAGDDRDPIVEAVRFSWNRIAYPDADRTIRSGEEYLRWLLDVIDYDLNEARRGNMTSPSKCACDTVWRDYRPVLTHTVDFGGLTPNSHRSFLSKIASLHNRIADGPSLTTIEKVRALIVADIVDLRCGKTPEISFDRDRKRFVAQSNIDGSRVEFEKLIFAFLERFDPEHDTLPLYPKLLERGMLSLWRNVSADGTNALTAGLALDSNLHPIGDDDRVHERITLIGMPIEGMRFFHHTLCRSDVEQPTIANLVKWANNLEVQIGPASRQPMDERQTIHRDRRISDLAR